MSWKMFVYKYPDCYMHFGCYAYVKIHGLSYPIVEVELTENENGEYYGWIDSEGDLNGSLVWPSNAQTEMCFAYGSKIEEERGRGKKIRLSVVEIKQ